MKEVLSEIDVWKARGDRIALATVIDVQRSAPRPPGRRWPSTCTVEIAGSVSGGCVEGAVAEIADGILRGDPPQLVPSGSPTPTRGTWGYRAAVRSTCGCRRTRPGRFEEVALAWAGGATR